MDGGPGTDPGALGFFLGSWTLMMAAMMLPALTPLVLRYREIQIERRVRGDDEHAADAALLLAGYLATWTAAGLLAYALLEAGRTLAGGLLAWDRAGRFTAAGVLAAAALYQRTACKRACLSRCRSRRAFLLRSGSREGRAGALRVGIEHGAWCVGCCWALMAALFALGAMSIAWMALVALLIAAERLLPRRGAASAAVASLLLAVSIAVAVAPARVPMLTIPRGAAAVAAMGGSPARHVRAPMGTTPTPRARSMPR